MARVTLELVGFVVSQTNLNLRLPWIYSRSAERAQRTVYGFWSKESLSAWSRADVVRTGEMDAETQIFRGLLRMMSWHHLHVVPR
ncbi:hypothetical protein PITC_036030 [Penicillium italicum]|uniref:Uncharacterized protein n=1 Tax=Penicillium italicum TaxID=40296 RepID=A0A0A2LPP6_PENIT|nr:hypothetical protein PITC_036030 [Penicillium italicum]